VTIVASFRRLALHLFSRSPAAATVAGHFHDVAAARPTPAAEELTDRKGSQHDSINFHPDRQYPG